jgi:hypothetical protein
MTTLGYHKAHQYQSPHHKFKDNPPDINSEESLPFGQSQHMNETGRLCTNAMQICTQLLPAANFKSFGM